MSIVKHLSAGGSKTVSTVGLPLNMMGKLTLRSSFLDIIHLMQLFKGLMNIGR